MALVLWDASALAKRFVAETGSQTVNAVFSAIPRDQMVTTILGYSETFAAILRKHNQGILTVTAFTAAQEALRNEVIDDPDFAVLGLEFDDILDGIELVRRHNLNSSDGAILHAYLKHATPMRRRSSVCWLPPTNDCCVLRKPKVSRCLIQRAFSQWMYPRSSRRYDRRAGSKTWLFGRSV